MKKIIFLAMLVVGFASCDTTSTATGSTDSHADSSTMNSTSTDAQSTTKDTSGMSKTTTDTSNTKKDTIPQ